MHGPAHHHRGHRRPGPGALPLLLVVAVVAASAPLLFAVAAVLAFVGPVVLVVAALAAATSRPRPSVAGWRAGALHRPGPHPVQVPGTGPRPVGAVPLGRYPRAAPPPATWAGTRASFARLQREYAAFECDPLAVLRTPALADVAVPSTGRFVEAFAEAQALDTDVVPPPPHQARAATAVDRAWRCWRAARDAAERIRLAGVPAAERAAVERAIKLLTVARDAGSEAERTAAYGRARAELARLERAGAVRVPNPATAALEVAARRELPPGAADGGATVAAS